MGNKILYPRGSAKFYDSQPVKRQIKRLERAVDELKNHAVVKQYFESVRLLSDAKDSLLRFECESCGKKFAVKDLTLYRFVSYSDGPDEWRYEDDNIICPYCNYYSIVDQKEQKQKWFKEIVEK